MTETADKLEKPDYQLRHVYNNVTRWGELKVCVGPDYILFGVRSLCDMFDIEWQDTGTDRLYDVSRTHKITVSGNEGNEKTMMLVHEGMRQWLGPRQEAKDFLEWADTVFAQKK